MHTVCLCISTGRTGTTYLSRTLRAAYRGEFDVHHEHLRECQSKPRRYLWRFDEDDFRTMRQDPDVADYLELVERQTERAPYVDVGPTNTPLVPLLAAAFPGRVRVLHIVREPVTSAASMVNFTMYAPRNEDLVGPDYPHHPVPPTPRESRCAHPEFADRWDGMTPFEKNLWRWAEYNLFAEEFRARFPDVPFLRVTSDDLFRDDVGVARRVAEFYALPPREIGPRPREDRNAANLNLRHWFPVGGEWRRYTDYPHVLGLAERLGVPVRPEGLEERMRRYAAPGRWELFRYRLRIRLTPAFWQDRLSRLTHRSARRDKPAGTRADRPPRLASPELRQPLD
jgi:hypothetical protein